LLNETTTQLDDSDIYDLKKSLHVMRNFQSRQGLHIGSRIDEWEIFVPLGTTHAGWIVGGFIHVPYLTARLIIQRCSRLPRYRP
jgi:hypothetical protein